MSEKSLIARQENEIRRLTEQINWMRAVLQQSLDCQGFLAGRLGDELNRAGKREIEYDQSRHHELTLREQNTDLVRENDLLRKEIRRMEDAPVLMNQPSG